MSIDFSPPSYRAASSDLTISISPLGLVELADEEFEVHGPRLNRYSLNWAMYLGHHTSYRRQAGESSIVLNYYRAITDFIINFTFSKGVQFRSEKATEAIIPNLLERVWEIDNNKATVLWEIGQQGGVSGDCFIKVAYEEGYQDPSGMIHPGRVRILPLNSSFAFPEFHPHDRERLIRFKLKYRFWGTSLEGTRQVYTYTEILTDDMIEEYINDELIDSRPNPLGVIPIVHIPNVRVSGSPWGLSDCNEIININRTYNEVATDIADIVNYHAAPVTVITGAKASQLEKGANKVWGGLPKDAKVMNLEGGGQGLKGAMDFMDRLKKSMHEMTGVPESALGQAQPISNTSGVALSIQFQPLMNRYHQKIVQYAHGLERVNELVLKTLAIKEPETFMLDPDSDTPPKPEQLIQLDPNDPHTYRTYVHFPPPLPLDKLIVLNEIQSLLSLGLQSKEGALRDLGEEFPESKLQEIRQELIDDALAEGSLNLIKTEIQNEIMALTGMQAGPDGQAQPAAPEQVAMAEQASGGPQILDPAILENLRLGEQKVQTRLVTEAYGTRLPQRQVPQDYQK
ncbi:Portal protein [uncultured Caudovirales phage]|uniref:Portal protein n=1 Tax=uncultured Caudovirales phage TaxID=2100421 RepID=A0A6J5L782_9CAUD|nr:Portal protein [uncultured Caudovirales phage]CAB5219199.1 Portal protein [uncultured Caudovirales phage]